MIAAKKSKNLSIVFIFVTACIVGLSVKAEYSGGTGEPNDPYLISTAEQLNNIGADSNGRNKHFKLIADINLADIKYSSAVIPELSGTLDGNGFTIRNLTIVGLDDLGLIGKIREGALVKNLGLVNAKIDGINKHIGILAGTNSGQITNCFSTGSVCGYMYVGGLIADNNQGEIINCYSTAAVTGGLFIGGLAGFNNGTVTACYSSGKVCGAYYVGGLTGYSENDAVINSFWDVETSGQAESSGGTGKTTAEMQTESTFLEAGMDFMYETDNGSEDIWRIDEGQDYPHLSWEPIEDNNNVTLEEIISGGEIPDANITHPSGSSGVKESFTEQFFTETDNFDLTYQAVMFTPATDGTFYSPIIKKITQLPTDPSGGTAVELEDDGYATVNLSGQKKVLIYGMAYSRFFIGSNGYVTFTQGDTSREDMLDIHFFTKRISVLFADLDPAKGGEIKWKQLDDRVVVTWKKISEFVPTNSNTFQVEMYFDGKIQLAWLEVESQNGIVGLSQGRGLPEDFLEADFSKFPSKDEPGPGPNPAPAARRNRKK